jgi:hypothetical protein
MATDELRPDLVEAFRKLRAAWPTRGWSWDGRFFCLASSFDSELAPRARSAAQLVLPHQWIAATLATAPAPLRDFTAGTGGLRPGQALFGSDPIGRSHVYGLWWPWNDNDTISLRIGLVGPDFNERHNGQLRDVFGVTL